MDRDTRAVKFSEAIRVDATAHDVWQVLSDADAIGSCVPGLEKWEVYDGGLAVGGTARIKVGSSALAFPARVSWVEQNAPHGGNFRASAVLAGYEIEGYGTIALSENATGETTVLWEADVVIPEKLAENPLVLQVGRMFATRFFKGFFECLRSRLEAV